jgi:tRNA isopentenyl-2-thiomethyl-A-37 hydroxylase MiaE
MNETPQTEIPAANALPPRVQTVLDACFAEIRDELGTRLPKMLDDLAARLGEEAVLTRSHEIQSQCLDNLAKLQQQRTQLLPLMLSALQSQLYAVRKPQAGPADGGDIDFRKLALVDNDVLDHEVILNQIVRRHETRSRAALQLLSQRFGVLAGSPAFEFAHIPAGPRSLCHALSTSVSVLEFKQLDVFLLLYRSFDTVALDEYGAWLTRINQLLDREGVLPGLVFQSARVRIERARNKPAITPQSTGDDTPKVGWSSHPVSAWPLPSATAAPTGGASFADLQQLLSTYRQHSGIAPTAADNPAAALPTEDVLNALQDLQAHPPPLNSSDSLQQNMQQLQAQALDQLRATHGPDAKLSQQAADTFDLLGMLYQHIAKEVRGGTSAMTLLMKLQAPLAQAALRDDQFFLRPQHPARDLLDTVAESVNTWMSPEDPDPHLTLKLHESVDQVLAEYKGDDAVFEHAERTVREHVKKAEHKAELNERRHIEAAHGRERLEIAKQDAAQAIKQSLNGLQPQKFVESLLNHAWCDALTLVLLRNGNPSAQWEDALRLTERIVTATCSPEPQPADPELAAQVQDALVLAGYRDSEAAALARQMSGFGDEPGEQPSRTELAAMLKSRGRLGEGIATERHEPLPPRTPEEESCYGRLVALPFGVWFDFVKNQQGDTERQRLSWYSRSTGHALFVNQRGNRVGERTLDQLARLMARDQVRIVAQNSGRLIDNAWRKVLNTMRNLTSGAKT